MDVSRYLTLEQIEKRVILHRMRAFDGDRALVARSVGLTLKTLRLKLRHYGVVQPPRGIRVLPERLEAPLPDGDLFTTGEVARITGLAQRTVARYIDRGIIRGFRIPCSQDRRVTRRNLRAFLDQLLAQSQRPQVHP